MDGPAIVVSGRAAADGSLRGIASGEVPVRGTYLAPWLTSANLLGYRAGAVVALRYDPREPQPLRYASALRSRFAGETATAAGYEAWRAATGRTDAGRTHLYALVRMISVLPAETGHEHRVRGGWLPGSAITRVTPPALDD
ncbi:hypothetical protein HC028_15735 [Planosporangium flavigriseum]|uniref:hypothetical protein n=1 Tax=Planosporangium flavigriseum TaxID=373681 RepID=UPI0014395688|nr:hypothetical protein [Planosporangium flavigriseum]NJC65941.1 hypothetical protein [Planosporangium flavigriseum]